MFHLRLPAFSLLVLALISILQEVNAQGSSCKIVIYPRLLHISNTPILVDPEGNKMIYPEQDNGKLTITINPERPVAASCSGRNNYFKNFDANTLTVLCDSSNLNVVGLNQLHPVQWTDLECRYRHQADLRRSYRACENQGEIYDIGWDLGPYFFLPHIEICFNRFLETTLYAIHEIQGSIIGDKPASAMRPPFLNEGLFSGNIAEAYKIRSQRDLFENLLGPSTKCGKGQHFLAKGHLAPDADFFYKVENEATYFYANVVPQWQSFNNKNWKSLEYDVRRLAQNHSVTLRIWTGTYGVLQLPNAFNNAVEVLLGKPVVPVPAVMWKVIQNLHTGNAVAIVGINDFTGQGTSRNINLSEPPCNDICYRLGWISSLRSKMNIIEKGRIFCCKVDDLRNSKITYLPNLGDVGLLTD